MIIETEIIARHIRVAFELLKGRGYKYGDVDLSGDRVCLCTSIHSELSNLNECCGIKVVLCDLQSSYNYFLCINAPSKQEVAFLKCHREAMQLE